MSNESKKSTGDRKRNVPDYVEKQAKRGNIRKKSEK